MIRIPHLETNVTVACQLRCVSCNHFVALQTHEAKQRIADPLQMERDLAHLSKVCHADAYGMLGGEPLLHPNLIDVLSIARASGVADVIEVWTNGLSIQKQDPAFWRAFDRLVVSVYPGTLSDTDLEWITGKCAEEAIDLIVKDERTVPNFERLLEPGETGIVETRAKYRACFFSKYSRVVDRGFFYRCCTSPFIPRLLLGLPEGTDGIAVEGLTESALTAFLYQEETPRSCAKCAGLNPADRHHMKWREVRDPVAWVAASEGGTAV